MIGVELAHGSYGVVFEGSLFGTTVAVKQLYCKGLPAKERRVFERECEMMASCRHPNLVMFMGRVVHDNKVSQGWGWGGGYPRGCRLRTAP